MVSARSPLTVAILSMLLMFWPDDSEPCLAARHKQTGRDIRILAPQQDKNAPPKYMTVHVINGARSDQRTFEECLADEPPLQERLRQYHQRVVVSIETPEMFNR